MIERKAHTRNKITMLSNKIVCHKTFYHIFVNLKESSRLRLFVLFLVSLCIFSLLITLKIKFGLLLCTCGDQRTAVGVSSLLPPLGSQGMMSGCHAQWQEPFPPTLLTSPAPYLWVTVIKLCVHPLSSPTPHKESKGGTKKTPDSVKILCLIWVTVTSLS